MKAARRAIAFFSGALLYSVAVLAAMKYANTGLPRSWYVALGGRNTLGVALGEAVVIALLLFVLALGWSYLTLRPTRRRHRPYVAWLLAGIGLAWAGWLISGAFGFALQPRAYAAPLRTILLASNAAPLFGVLNILGVLAGAGLAGRFARRHQLALPRTRPQHLASREERATPTA